MYLKKNPTKTQPKPKQTQPPKNDQKNPYKNSYSNSFPSDFWC